MSVLPIVDFDDQGHALGRWWHEEDDGRILCTLCPRACRLKPGDRGFCFVRTNVDGQMVLDTYGRSTGFCIDPIEKKPLNHFLPGTPILSFGTAGCNLGCKFCQNWDISKSREVARLSNVATPDAIAAAAQKSGCRSVAFTYNDPVIWAEYAIDTAAACRAVGIKSVAVTAGYITEQARGEFFDSMDAANIDLKGFSEEFYFGLTGAHLQNVLDTIAYVCRETSCWVELTNLIIPDANDGDDELRKMVDWILEAVGSDVPVHFTAFHPDFRMTDRPRTSHDTLIRAYDIANQAGLRYVYVGNVHDVARQSTYCPSCRQLLIERDWHQIGHYAMEGNRCRHCQFEVAGHFEAAPGNWGQRRQPIRIEPVSQSPCPAPAANSATESQPRRDRESHSTDAQERTMEENVKKNRLEFSEDEQQRIMQAAARVVCGSVFRTQPAGVHDLLGDTANRPIAGVYVTLKRGEVLRGCCGVQGEAYRLVDALVNSAGRTALHDPRMPPVSAVELKDLHLSVSMIGPARPIEVEGDDRINAVEIGKQGLRIEHNGRAGLLLPSVARERDWDGRQFLDAVCRKAGLSEATWRGENVNVSVFDGVDFGRSLAELVRLDDIQEVGLIAPDQIEQLCRWVHQNIVAFQTGATPMFYANSVADATVPGIALQVAFDPNQRPSSLMQFTIRDGVPLQSTLYHMTQRIAAELNGVGHVADWQVRIGVLSSIVQHGVDAQADVASLDCKRRGILAVDGARWSFQYDRSGEPNELMQNVIEAEPFHRGVTPIFSAVCDCNVSKIAMASGPRGETVTSTRSPGVAGRFYPAGDKQREELVDKFLDDEDIKPRKVRAAMVPHAGLMFSGKVAADVWRRIEIPNNVLIIGPKHTRDGVDWAVAPHDVWQLSETTQLEGAADLASQIADQIPGMQLDAIAHRAEHGIEVQLPILHRLAPQTRIAAIAMGHASYTELVPVAKAMADWIRGLEDPPLLVISSDMNHFADDEENRRRDAIALELVEKNDPKSLLRVCDEQSISMCGRVPAALVLMTLAELGQTPEYEKIAYCTSGDITGDRDRVVGYAGVLF